VVGFALWNRRKQAKRDAETEAELAAQSSSR
jgi:hypothetical protein